MNFESNFSNYPTFDREKAERDYNRQIAGLVHSRIKASEQYSWQQRRALPGYYDAYRGILQAKYHVHKNNVNVPTLTATILSSVARKARALTSGTPITFVGTDAPGGATIARKQQALYYQQWSEDDGPLKLQHFLTSADLYGTAVSRIGWKYLMRPGAQFEMVRSPVDGKMYKIGSVGDVIEFDGWENQQIDLLDSFLEPGKSRPRDARWGADRCWLDLDAVEDLVESGTFSNRSEFNRLKAEGSMSTDLADDIKQLRGLEAISGHSRLADPYGRPVQITTMIGHIPRELAKDGITMRMIVTANNMYVLENIPLPYAHQRLDYVYFTYSPFYDPHYLFAPGKIEIGLRLSRAINDFTNQSLDGLAVGIDPWMFVNEEFLLDPRGVALRPGRIVRGRGNPNENVMAGQFNMQGVQMGIESAGVLDRWIQKGTGIVEDVSQGMGGSDRQTAREFLGRAEAVGTRLDNEIILCELMALVPQADAAMELNRQFLTKEREAELLGDLAEIDPVTGGQIAMTTGDKVVVTPQDIAVRLRARAVGTSMRLSKAMQMQNAQLLFGSVFQAAAADPTLLAQLNLIGWVRFLGRIAEIGPEVNELVVTDPQQQAAKLALMAEAMQKSTPGGEPQPGEQPIEDGAPSGVQDEGDIGSLIGSLSGGLEQ